MSSTQHYADLLTFAEQKATPATSVAALRLRAAASISATSARDPQLRTTHSRHHQLPTTHSRHHQLPTTHSRHHGSAVVGV